MTDVRPTLLLALAMALPITGALAQSASTNTPADPVFMLHLQPPADAGARRERFAARDSDGEVAALAHQLHAALFTEQPGLAAFDALVTRGDYRAALDAFRAFVFDRLLNRAPHGIPATTLWAEKPGAPDPAVLADQRNGRRRVSYEVRELTTPTGAVRFAETVAGFVGEPGATLWAPPDALGVPDDATWGYTVPSSYNLRMAPEHLHGPFGSGGGHPFWATPQGREAIRQIEFFSAGKCSMNFPQFDALLASYAETGDTNDCVRWQDYLDDWHLFGRTDVFRSRLNLLLAIEGGSRNVRDRLITLCWLLENRPEFATTMRSTTLARFLLGQIEDAMPYTVRMSRTEIANWGIYATSFGLLHMVKIFPEFRAVDYLGRQGFGIWKKDFLYVHAPDGHNTENERGPYQSCSIEAYYYAFEGFQPPWLDPREMDEVTDKARRSIRQILAETTPDGIAGAQFRTNYWNSAYGVRHAGNWVVDNDPVFDEPEIRARLNLVNGWGGPLPRVLSELTPYGGKFMLRDQWGRDGGYFFMENYRDGSQNPMLRTAYRLRQSGDDLLLGTPILVDRRGPFPALGKILPVGGKTETLAIAEKQVLDTRFHTSAHIDFAEAKQDAPYSPRALWQAYYGLENDFVWGGHQRALDLVSQPITDVTAWRQAYLLRGEQLYIVTDRIESDRTHEYAHPLHLNLANDFAHPLKPGVAGHRMAIARAITNHEVIRVDAARARVATDLPGAVNVAAHFFSPARLQFFYGFDKKAQPLDNPIPFAKWLERPPKTPGYSIGVRWQGRGDQVLVSLQETIKSNAVSALREVEPLNGPAGQAGFRAATERGTRIWYQAGPHRRNTLAAGPVGVEGESLLVTERAGVLNGIVLSARSPLIVNGKEHTAPHDSFEFTVTAKGSVSFVPVRRPIDTVRVYPEQNVFTGTVNVSFDIPTQDTGDIEYRYTLDGTDPTLASTRYEKPFALTDTAMVKVRAFRKGLGETPYREGVDASAIEFAYFKKQGPRPALALTGATPGLAVEYAEDVRWGRLFVHAGEPGVVEMKARGQTTNLLDVTHIASLKPAPDTPFAIVYRGFLDVPADGVYTVHAPQHLFVPTADAGYNLRVIVDGEEWDPASRIHAEGAWSIALAKGAHAFEVRYVDYRRTPYKNEYWMIGHPHIQARSTPEVLISGPGLGPGPIPAEWLKSPAQP
jgi:hypothetical protein